MRLCLEGYGHRLQRSMPFRLSPSLFISYFLFFLSDIETKFKYFKFFSGKNHLIQNDGESMDNKLEINFCTNN